MYTLASVNIEIIKGEDKVQKLENLLNEERTKLNKLYEEKIFLEKGFKVGYVIKNSEGNIGVVYRLTSTKKVWNDSLWRKISIKTHKLHKNATYLTYRFSQFEVLATSYEEYIRGLNIYSEETIQKLLKEEY